MNIKKLEIDNDEDIIGVQNIRNHTHEFFTKKYEQKQTNTNSEKILLDSIEVFRTPQDNENLIKAISKEEILNV